MSAWDELGVTLDHPVSAEAAMKTGLLAGWNVRQVPMFATLPPVKGVSRQVEVTDRVAVVRDNPRSAGTIDYLSIVSKRYTVTANEAYTEVLDQLAEESGSVFAVAGEVDEGRCAFLTMKLPGYLDGGVEVYIAALNDHGGYKPFQLLVTPVHTATGSVLTAHEIGRVRHTPGAVENAASVARSALDSALSYLDGLQKDILRLDGTIISEAQFEHLVERNFGAPLDAPRSTQTRRRAQREELCEMFFNKEGGTAWEGFTTLTDWYDHSSAVRGDTSRAYKAIFDTGFKDRALRVLKEVS